MMTGKLVKILIMVISVFIVLVVFLRFEDNSEFLIEGAQQFTGDEHVIAYENEVNSESLGDEKKESNDVKEKKYDCNSGTLKKNIYECLIKDLCYWDYKWKNECMPCPTDNNFDEKNKKRLSLYKQECGIIPVECSTIKERDVCTALKECSWSKGCKEKKVST